jgi:metal-sulfur cluster biosynthetic enzyme
MTPAELRGPMVTEKDVRRALRKVKDPELNLDLVVLGLVYDVEVMETHVRAAISLTSPFCPVAGQIVDEARAAIEGIEGVNSVDVELTFSPAWTPDRIDPVIRASLGI